MEGRPPWAPPLRPPTGTSHSGPWPTAPARTRLDHNAASKLEIDATSIQNWISKNNVKNNEKAVKSFGN